MKSFEHIHTHPFKPIIFSDSKILILGTFPSLDSFKYEFYYAHKRNQFWKILENIFNVELKNIDKKIEFLEKYKIALWDIVKSCQRKNSSDTNLKNIELNDISKLLKDYPSIEKIGFTGQKSYKLYQKTIFRFASRSFSAAFTIFCLRKDENKRKNK